MSDISLSKRANLRDVARHAGVSVATVSRVMNMPGKVARDTRDRVEAAMDQLRFVPSAAARATSTGRTRIIGALVPTLDNAIFAQVLHAMEQEAAKAGLSLVVSTTNDDPELAATKVQALIDVGIEGLVVTGVTHAPSFFRLVQRAQIPTVAMSYFDPDYSLPTIGYDNAESARVALSHLTDLGHRNIAVLHGPSRANDRTRARIAGLESATQDVELSFFQGTLSVQGGCHLLSAAVNVKPTAILCLSDVLAAGVLLECVRQNIRVPQDLSVMGMDDLPMSASLTPPLTTLHFPVSRMGRQAATAIIDWVEKGEKPDPLSFDVALRLRESTGPV